MSTFLQKLANAKKEDYSTVYKLKDAQNVSKNIENWQRYTSNWSIYKNYFCISTNRVQTVLLEVNKFHVLQSFIFSHA